jgi:hypothetical protein
MGLSPPTATAVVMVVVAVALGAPAVASAMGRSHMVDPSVVSLPPHITNPVEYHLIGGDDRFPWYAL